jgi:Circularly permutated YpsA SLOG family
VNLIREIRSGGQTGVDRAALDVARELSIPYAGWCPRGGWAEDHPQPPGLLIDYPQLVETPSIESDQRSTWNIRDADATLILSRPRIESPGTQFTRVCAQVMYRKKPFLQIELTDENAVAKVKEWLGRFSQPFSLNVAGPRESEAAGIYEHAAAFLRTLLAAMQQPH